MKKTLLLLVALITTTIAFAQTEIDGINYNLNDETKTAEVTYQYQWSRNNYSGVTTITIPEKVTFNSTEYSVTSIGYVAFYSCLSLTSITIPNSVTSIGNYAFRGCPSLTSITIPNSVTSIGNAAFYNCSSLTSITIPNSVTYIGGSAFWGTPWLENQPDGCLYICKCLYQYKGEMPENTHIDVNEGTTMICSSAFESCSSLTSITIPNSVTYIGYEAFSSCSSLTSISIPNSVTSIEWGAFANCSSLTSITIPNNVTSIEWDAFANCSSLTSITIPNSVTYIGGYAFSGCSSLTSITIPGSVARLDSLQFTGCTSLSSVTILYGVTSITGSTFSGCSSLTSIAIPNSVTEIGCCVFAKCSSLTSITIPNSVTSIGCGVFSNCSSLTSISIPNSVIYIGESAFSDCESLTSITCLGTTPPEASNLGANTSTCTLIVPKEAYNNYLRHEYWGQFQTIRAIGDREIKTEVNNSAWGKVTGAGLYNENDEATLTATANSGYRFVKWSDEVTDNPRTVVVTQDSTFTAIFKVETYTITTAAAVPSMGNVKVTLIAEPIEGLVFDHWSDGNTENPRTLTLTEDIELYAYFKVAENTNVETSKISSANIYTTNGTLHIEGATENYHILDAAGRLIYSGNATTLQLPRGIYLITMGGEVEKILL